MNQLNEWLIILFNMFMNLVFIGLAFMSLMIVFAMIMVMILP